MTLGSKSARFSRVDWLVKTTRNDRPGMETSRAGLFVPQIIANEGRM